jgi:hypothetical protein
METVAITAGRRIRISVEGGFTVDALRITIIGMAGRTRFNDAHLIPFPGRQFMNLFVTISALNFINEMGAGIMFCSFFLMATMAGDRLGMDFCPFLVDMFFHIDDVPVATVTGVCSMNRLGELSLVDLVSVTTQAFGVIETLITVFAAFDDDLLALFLRLRRVHAFRGL